MLSNIFLLAAVPISKKETTNQEEDERHNQVPNLKCRPSDLPVYKPLHESNNLKRLSHPQKTSVVRENLESGVSAIRSELQAGFNILNQQKDNVNDYISTAKFHTQSTIDYLNEPHNILPRAGAIAIGGLAGFIFGVRGGIIKKFFYTSVGAGVVTSLCYPRQAEQFAQDALYNTRKGFAIAYNFVKGAKPGEAITIEPINKFPTSLEEVKFMVYDLYDEAKEALFPKKN